MNNLIRLDFKTKAFEVVSEPTPETPALEMLGPLEQVFADRLNRAGYTLKHVVPMIYDKIAARFGENQPKGGVTYKTCGFLGVDGIFYLDAYGRGCIHNADGNPYKAELQASGWWNRPMPFPVDLAGVYRNLKKLKGTNTVVQLGLTNDPLAWLDQKYKVSKEIISMLNELNIKHVIFTASDLIAHEDYINTLNPELCTVKMRMPRVSADELKQLEPGAPSLKRRFLALAKLAEKEIPVLVHDSLTWSKIEKQEAI